MQQADNNIITKYFHGIAMLTMPYYQLGEYFIPHDLGYDINHQRFSLSFKQIKTLEITDMMSLLAAMGVYLAIGLFLLALLRPAFYFDRSYPHLALLSITLFYIADYLSFYLNKTKLSKICFYRYRRQVKIRLAHSQQAVVLDFNQLSACVSQHTHRLRGVRYNLLVTDTVTTQSYLIRWSKEPVELQLLWYFIQHYMQAQLALADVPALESYRQYDRASIIHDITTQRSPYYWRHKSQVQAILAAYRAALKAANHMAVNTNKPLSTGRK